MAVVPTQLISVYIDSSDGSTQTTTSRSATCPVQQTREYATLGTYQVTVTVSDLKIDSAYNTVKWTTPPRPVSPGEAMSSRFAAVTRDWCGHQ